MPKRSQQTAAALRRKTDEVIKASRANDSKRLDWLYRHVTYVEIDHTTSWLLSREDIDQAISEEKPRAE
jgi:hypothetical protein